ncbi:MAG: hypothetical protein J5I93_07070 [Pirellulaceae bacterium]|nr:hypothetical protein [Pirellulaceae bacterium]
MTQRDLHRRRFRNVCAMLAFAANAVVAQPTPNGAQFQVNSYWTGRQYDARVAAAPEGNFTVVWTSEGSYGPDQHDRSIQGQRFHADGQTNGDEFQVNTYSGYGQVDPAVAHDGVGRFVVTWSNHRMDYGDTSVTSIQARLFSADGTPLGDQFLVNSYTTSIQEESDVAMGADGEFVVVWKSYGSNGPQPGWMSVQGRAFTESGVPLGDDFQVNDSAPAHYIATPSVAVDADGSFVVAWASALSPGDDTSGASVQARRYSADVVPLSPQFQVNTITLHDQRHPSAAMLSDGGFVVAWESYGSSIRARRFLSDGTPTGPDFQVNTLPDYGQGRPSVAASERAGFVVTWEVTQASPLGSKGVRLRRYFADGTPDGDDILVNTHTGVSPRSAAVAADRLGNLLVVFHDNGPATGSDPHLLSVQARRFDAMFRDGFELGDSTRWSASSR